VFKNHGASAGASMAHSHSQMIGTPFVPPSVNSRLNCMKEVFERSGKCSLCEIGSKDILVSETHNFSAIVPFAASYPFEIWIIPREHSSYFHEINQDKVRIISESMYLKFHLVRNHKSSNYIFCTNMWAIA
jgi:UDPglucose--hexose-1-phosphate uridylyltransferase